MKKSTLSALATCSTMVLLTACGGSAGTNTDTAATNSASPEITMPSTSVSDTTESPKTDPETTQEPTTTPEETTPITSLPAVDADGYYDLGRYILVQQTGTMIRDRYREEVGSLVSQGQANLQVDAPMQTGVWIQDGIGFTDTLKISEYRVNDETIDVRIYSTGITEEVELNRYVKIGENAATPDAPFNATVFLTAHNDEFDTVMNGMVVRSDTDVITLKASVDVLNTYTELDINLSRDFGAVSGVDKDCVINVFFLETVDDSRTDCDSVRTDYIILDAGTMRQS